MSIEAFKISFLFYLKNLGLYDYIALSWFVITFFVLIFFAILLARKSAAASLFFIILALVMFVTVPFIIKTKLGNFIRPVKAEVTMLKKLTFSPSLIVEGKIHNLSNKDFTKCLLQTFIIKDLNTSALKAYTNLLKPIANQSILVVQPLIHNDFIDYKVVFDDFKYDGNITASIKTECY